jgi:acetoin utilization protein AcuB
MKVCEHMSQPAISVSPTTPVAEASKLLHERRIRRLPVIDNHGVLVGIVSERDLLRVMPSPATTLSVWEIPELLERLLIKDVMTRDVITVTTETPIQDAAQLMVDNKVGGLPVEDEAGRVVGMITETDIFRVFCSLFAGDKVLTPA